MPVRGSLTIKLVNDFRHKHWAREFKCLACVTIDEPLIGVFIPWGEIPFYDKILVLSRENPSGYLKWIFHPFRSYDFLRHTSIPRL